MTRLFRTSDAGEAPRSSTTRCTYHRSFPLDPLLAPVSIGPRRKTTLPGINRFAWPTLTNVEPKDLVERGRTQDVREDAWRQVVDLSDLAERKVTASHKAIGGFGSVIVVGGLLVTMSMAFTQGQDDPPVPPSQIPVRSP